MIKAGKWEYSIEQDEDDNWIWCLYYDWQAYDPEDVICSKSFKTLKACEKDAMKYMKKMHSQFGELIVKVSKAKS